MALASGTIQGVVGLEAGVGKRKYLPGVEVAQTPEEKITAGLLEVQHCFAGASHGLSVVAIGMLNLAWFTMATEEQAVLFFVQMGLGVLLLFSCIVWTLRVQPWPKVSLVTDREVRWHAPSSLLAIVGVAAFISTFSVPIISAFNQGPEWEKVLKSDFGILAMGTLIAGAFVALSRIAAGLETLAWIKDIRRGEGVVELSTGQRITKQAEQEPQLPSWAQTL
ncbi:hypothetical protein [Aquidulcibacter sp.]|uniref:hypothetical protein n=1 Tax=Aquidulcibacter sp. TaxID=2052990 RepID=UPI003BA6302E